MTEERELTVEELDRLEALFRAAHEQLGEGPWTRTQPETWISAPSKLGPGWNAHVADIRGWGYLTGRGHALALEEDEAFEAQKAWGDLIVSAVNALPILVAAARRSISPAPVAGNRRASPPSPGKEDSGLMHGAAIQVGEPASGRSPGVGVSELRAEVEQCALELGEAAAIVALSFPTAASLFYKAAERARSTLAASLPAPDGWRPIAEVVREELYDLAYDRRALPPGLDLKEGLIVVDLDRAARRIGEAVLRPALPAAPQPADSALKASGSEP